MRVKWYGEVSSERKLNGGGPQGATFGIWNILLRVITVLTVLILSKDLTVLEKVNLLIVGLSSFNCELQCLMTSQTTTSSSMHLNSNPKNLSITSKNGLTSKNYSELKENQSNDI